MNIKPISTLHVCKTIFTYLVFQYSETADAIFSEKLSNAFESFDVVLRGTNNFPEVIAPFFELSFPIPMGPVSVDLGKKLLSFQTFSSESYSYTIMLSLCQPCIYS